MNTRSKGIDPISPISEPQKKTRLLQKAAQLNLTKNPHHPEAMDQERERQEKERRDREDREWNDREEDRENDREDVPPRRPVRKNFYEDDGLDDDDDPYGREEYSPIVFA